MDLNTKNKISKTRIESGICKGEKNPRYVKLSKAQYDFITNLFMKKNTIKKINDELNISVRIINRAIKELKLL